MIELKNLYKAFGSNKVLDDLNLKIQDNEIFVILGKSGMGKSVILKHIVGLMKPDQGDVLLDDYHMNTLEGIRLYEALKNVATIYQMGALFDSMTVAENVGFYLREHLTIGGKKINKSDIRGLVAGALKLVGLEGIEDLYPSDISGGMKKRVSIARGSIYKPKYICYDEPTTGLDPVTALAIGECIEKQQDELKGTTIVVSHDIPTTLRIADRIALLDNGRVEICADPLTFMQTKHPIIDEFNASIGGDLSLIKRAARRNGA
ncbi:MAG: putative ribonucleotide transport ATP-binding protein mkl [Chlamydiia bacterium]|nr:putative ribonucleotide transport ATP-binding protein mkl [Chlamydiia bacterium]MCH9618194.1 putative ribonucleotide transport ATP-binding protein mkl [Chlamydiia bacterium]MCH9624083.1 putative ribonucleotide transport ATP-binding protein mkl [Chlamydiia bacterium]